MNIGLIMIGKNMTNEELINKCILNDRVAQKYLFDKYSGKALGICHRYFHDKMDAEEAMQIGFIRIFQHLHQFKHTGSFEGWIHRTIVHANLNLLKEKKKLAYDEFHESVIHNDNYIIDLEKNYSADYLLNLVKELDVGYRTIFNLYAIEGYPHKEIAKLLGISINTSKSQYMKARQRLMEKLKKYNM